ncbi:MAG: glucose-1-phosphate thymidylyltransferase RfbA [Ignavibacteria bacterium]|jgi:glucose-1-phosphate thymidylyltransferase|nr:glucose-1-phosphate thymidylyltransferase RfbA [Ignavibacteria bacterium]MCU7503720.1 glucose-1-phosphate thymidylyltransferase RfbA [Ignavibacteria bacterium]MCU7517634.1 glucose-1-phosphate thymidylyltransferase RfbA [Ignavibacteria bacterium]
MKGIILAGGAGTRLQPVTQCINKNLLPVYNKPMVYYPLTTLMQAGIRDILVISTPQDVNQFQHLLKDGSQWGISISYAVQHVPKGIAEAFLIAESFINDDETCLILGDNIFFGSNLCPKLKTAAALKNGALVFGYPVDDPERFGVVEFDSNGHVKSLEEKPAQPKSNFAVTGLYFYDKNVVSFAKQLKPSKRGELEITDLNKIYLSLGLLNVELLDKGIAYLDTGTHESLLQAANLVENIETHQRMVIGSPEETALNNGWITSETMEKLAYPLMQNGYGKYLSSLTNFN